MRRAPGALRCLFLIALCDIGLRGLGFARALRVARWCARAQPAPISDALVEQTLHGIAVATAFYPGRSKCLEQALATFILLRRRGAPVNVRLGVQPYPFVAHAWVELNGQPITESPEVVARFALLPDLAV
jgi:hypothetical protein